MENVELKFAERLKSLRIEKGLSQNALSKLIGVSQPTIARWEAAQVTPSIEDLAIVALFFQVSCDFLIGLVEY